MTKKIKENKGGRPTKYKKEYCEELKNFFSKERFREIKVITTGKNEYKKTEIKQIANALPTFEAFAEKIGVARQRLYDWEKKHKKFQDTMGYCRGIQKDFLIQNGLMGLFQSNFAIFVAKNLTDMKDKSEIEHKGKMIFLKPRNNDTRPKE